MKRAVQIAFPHADEAQKSICTHILPSVVTHLAWIQETLPVGSGVFSNPLFTTPGLLESLKPLVVNGVSSSDFLTATGVPAQVEQMLLIIENKKEIVSAKEPKRQSRRQLRSCRRV
eukprot:SAG22_NODE_312_length_12614_cov_4.783540_3_plen_116_part_00